MNLFCTPPMDFKNLNKNLESKNFKDGEEGYISKRSDLVIFDYKDTVEGKDFEGNEGKNNIFTLKPREDEPEKEGEVSPQTAVEIVMEPLLLSISAMILPGISGAFILLIMGMYEVTLNAVKNGNFVYLILFISGAFTGIIILIPILKWLFKFSFIVAC